MITFKKLLEVLVDVIKENDRGKCPYALHGDGKKCYDESGHFIEDFGCEKCSKGYYESLGSFYYEKFKVSSEG